uniref:Uncharacterized protein n=1 Tax=Opuntia streptacantha TaxID=393608 RepID=A0A7C9A3J8_OPUST
MRGRKESDKAEGDGALSRSCMELNGKELDFRSIMKEVQLLGSSDMTWKERKDLQNKKIVSLGGKRLPLSVARPMMKNQKAREQKMLEEALLLGHCGEQVVTSTKKPVEKRKPEYGVLKSSEGHFKNGILDVKHLLKRAAPPTDDSRGPPMASKGGKKKKKGGKKNHGKRKGGGRKRH